MNREDQRIINSFSKALELIDQLRKAKGGELNHQRDLLIWRSAAEAEYLAFLIATNHGLNDFIPRTDKGVAASADTAHDLVEKASRLLQSHPRLAYANVRQSVSILRALSTYERRTRRPQSFQPENK